MGDRNDVKPAEEPVNHDTVGETRRTFLRAMGAASAVAGTGAVAGAQETTTEDETTATDETTTASDATPIVLGARVSGWYGLVPASIEGEQNPTLALRDGESYRLIWINLDGQEHEWHLEDEDGNIGDRTDAAQQVGATREVVFEASEQTTAYRCEYHPDRMVGTVELGEGFETTAESEETTADGETAEDSETTEDGETTAATGDVTDVAVGPEGQYLRFVPEEVEISVGDTVRWTAESEGHNVSAKPEASSKVELPDGTEPFATYEGSRSFMVMEVDETYEHTFTTPGTYVYVCVPHAGQGMVGTVVVTE